MPFIKFIKILHCFIFIVLAAVALLSCTGKESGGSTHSKDSLAVEQVKSGTLTDKPGEAIIMKLLYGGYDKEETQWNASNKKLDPEIGKFSGGDDIFTAIILNESKSINGSEKIFFVTSSNLEGNDCHACAPFLGAFVFEKGQAGWQCTVKDYYIGEIGTFGEPPAAKLAMIGEKEPALLFEGDDLGQGYYMKYVSIYALYKNKFTEAANITVESNNSGTEEEQWGFKKEYSFVPGSNPDFYDLVIETDGTLYDDNFEKIIPVKKKERFVFSNGKYILLKDISS